MIPASSVLRFLGSALFAGTVGIGILTFLAIGLTFAMMIAFPEDAAEWFSADLD